MTSLIIATNVIDFASAANKIKTRHQQAATARPFNGRLLKRAAAAMRPDTLAVVRRAVLEGYGSDMTNRDIVATIRRDLVRAAARAAL